MYQSISSRGDWLRKPANIKFENSGTVSSLCWKLPDLAKSFVFSSQIATEKIMRYFYRSVSSK